MKRNFVIILILLLSLFAIGCKKENIEKVKVVSISVDETTIPEYIFIFELDEKLSNIKINVNKSNGSTEQISLDKSMIFPNDYNKLLEKGTHTFTVSYEFTETILTLNTLDRLPNYYSIKVVYPDDTPVLGVNVEVNDGTNVVAEEIVNDDGIAIVDLAKGHYYVNISNFPEGYIYVNNSHVINEENKEIVIKLIPITVIEEGEGNSANPFCLLTGYYFVGFEEQGYTGMQYFLFTAPEDGTYTIQSLSNTTFSDSIVDPYLIFIDKNGDFDKSGNLDSSINRDFSYKVEAKAGETFKFSVIVSYAQKLPANFIIKIDK